MDTSKAVDLILEGVLPSELAESIVVDEGILDLPVKAYRKIADIPRTIHRKLATTLYKTYHYLKDKADDFTRAVSGVEGNPEYEKVADKFWGQVKKIYRDAEVLYTASVEGGFDPHDDQEIARVRTRLDTLKNTAKYLYKEVETRVKRLKKYLPHDARMGAKMEFVRDTVKGVKTTLGRAGKEIPK